MTKAEFFETLYAERAKWDSLLAKIDEARMVEPAIDGWSVKDIIAHIVWHEREMVEVLQARALVGSEFWNLPLDKRNAAIFEENRQRSLADVRVEAQQVYTRFVEALQILTDEELNDASRFADMPAEWAPWELIASNCYEHYRDHIRDIQVWLKTEGESH